VKIILVLISAVLTIYSFPYYDFYFFAFFAIAPLIYIAVSYDKNPFLTGFLWGIAAYSGIIYWVTNAVNVYGNVNIVFAWCANLLLICYMAAYSGIFALLVRDSLKYLNISPFISAPIIWTALEWGRTFIFSGFPWALFGSTQYKNIPFIQIANITGVYGVSFLLILCNAALVEIALALKNKTKKPIVKAAATIVIIGIVFSYGIYSINKHDKQSIKKVKVSLIQANIEQAKKWNPKFQDETIKKYAKLTLSRDAENSKLIVWPETAVPFFYQKEEEYQKIIKQLSLQSKADLLFGSPAYEVKDKEHLNFFNRAYFLSNNAASLNSYDKMHLVPFGEYVPSFIPFLAKLVYGIGEFIPGKEHTVFKSESGNFSVLICFEGIFPAQSREFVKKGADFLVNITNDAWYGKSSAPYQHLSLSIFRAVENNVPLIRAANTGISAIIDKNGRIKASSDIFIETAVSGEIYIGKSGRTFYTEFGDVFSILITTISVVISGKIFIRRRKNARKIK